MITHADGLDVLDDLDGATDLDALPMPVVLDPPVRMGGHTLAPRLLSRSAPGDELHRTSGRTMAISSAISRGLMAATFLRVTL